VALDTRQQSFVAWLANLCGGSKSKVLCEYPTPGAPVGHVAATEHAPGRSAETIRWPDPGEMPEVKATILEDDSKANRAAELWVKEKRGKSGSGTWTWWTDRLQTDNERLGAVGVCLYSEGWTVFESCLGTGRMEVLTHNYGRLESHFESVLRKRKHYEHTESQQWLPSVIRMQPSDGWRTCTQGQGSS
jgi:hypothetical protein